MDTSVETWRPDEAEHDRLERSKRLAELFDEDLDDEDEILDDELGEEEEE
jgi:hypothetical protein